MFKFSKKEIESEKEEKEKNNLRIFIAKKWLKFPINFVA